MRKILNIIALLIVAGVAGIYFTLGPSFLIGGPKTSDIVDVSRAVLIATAADPSQANLAKAAKISPKGLCSHNQDGSYACLIDIEIEGTAPKSLVAVLKKGAGGAWIATE
ncbi:MAG: hypothetical protein U1A24_15655 [Cypionkella sp.]|uniref:hypothetical protein n=1 Tax=Cypionkella sp. TaxID=2811411 RepID=UPI002AB93191|nr:hypothetical protein [Cypionkella sp.]MDZ4311981.1 hypothetical protein [Cypionkella sp.]MDZ4393814.1 hypothetical protein [Cypionkella sp.]